MKFYIQIDDGERSEVRPIWTEDANIVYEMESQERFYRKRFDGKLRFIGNDYDIINNARFDSTMWLYVEYNNVPLVTTRFYKTDCTFDVDNKKIEVSPKTYDEYEDVINGMEKEYNLAKMGVDNIPVRIYKRPMVQIYVSGDSVVSCFLSNMAWEQSATSTTDGSVLYNTYHFRNISLLGEIWVTAGTGAPEEINGLYTGEVTNENLSSDLYLQEGRFIRNDGLYYITYVQYQATHETSYTIYDANDTPMYQFLGTVPFIDEVGGLATPFSGFSGFASIETKGYFTYGRMVCDVDTISGVGDTFQIPTDDIVADNRNYHRVIPYDVNVIRISNRYSDEPTEWGMTSDGRYFMPPSSVPGVEFYPVARSSWKYASLWYSSYIGDEVLEPKARAEYTLKDACTIGSAIRELLKEVAPGITHEATEEYSQFLYGSNPISGINTKLMITAKSNVLAGDYQTPALNAPITLQKILDMLRNVYKCYWFIEDNKLKIEHVEFFRNGGSYVSTTGVGIDLTTLINVRNGKAWSFGTSVYKYDKADMPERFQYSWMDDATTIFNGYPIEVISPYVEKGNVEDVVVADFSADIDYILLNPAEISNDGFVLLATMEDSSGLYTPITTMVIDGIDYRVQNSYLSFCYLQPTFLLYDFPASNARVNNSDTLARSIKRDKVQELKHPANFEINPLELIKTNIGNGNIEKISINLSSRTASTTLRYDTE